MALNQTQLSAVAWIDANQARLSEFNARIWSYAEPAWREYKSARAYVDLLRDEGFTVEEGSGGMPTAFVATLGQWRAGAGELRRVRRRPRQFAAGRALQAPREGCIPVPPATPIRIHRSAPPRWPASWRPRRRCRRTAARHAEVVRRARREGLRLQADPRGEGLLRRLRRLHGLASCTRPTRYRRDPVRRLLERRDHLRALTPERWIDTGLMPIRNRRTPRRGAPARSTRCA